MNQKLKAESRKRKWIPALLLVLAGCSVPHDPSMPPLPPMPAYGNGNSFLSPSGMPEVRQRFSASLVEVPAPTLRLQWDYPPAELPHISHFRIYSSPDLVNWSVRTNLPAPWNFLRFNATDPQQFFRVTALGTNGMESEFATTQ